MPTLTTLQKFKLSLDQADAVLIGVSNGLSVAEGYDYYRPGAWFQAKLGAFSQRYGFKTVLEGANYHFKTATDYWSFQTAVAMASTFSVTEVPVSQALYQLVQAKPHFVLTTLVDDHLEKGGFASSIIFEVEGNYQRLQRADLQGPQAWPAETAIRAMATQLQSGELSAADLPHDPSDGALLVPAVGQVVHDANFERQQQALQNFIQTYQQRRVVLLEVGVGPHHPVIQPLFGQLQRGLAHVTRLSLNMTLLPSADCGLTGDIKTSLASLNRLSK